jgi:hypothetical protein
MHKKLWRTFINHPNVVKEVRAKAGNTNTTGVISESDMSAFWDDMGWPTKILVDEASGLETDGVVSNYTSWDESNIVLTGAGMIGKVKNAKPITLNPNARLATTEGGRIKILETFDDSRNIQSLELECLAMPVLTTAKRHIILDTSRTSSWT